LSRLCAMPIARRRARLNKPLIVKQNWIAATLYFGRRPRLPRLHCRASTCPCPARRAGSQAPSMPCCRLSSWSFGTLVLLEHSCRQFTPRPRSTAAPADLCNKAVLGHYSLAMTMRYVHLSPEHLQEARQLNPLARLNLG
jgi:hypothetical protein